MAPTEREISPEGKEGKWIGKCGQKYEKRVGDIRTKWCSPDCAYKIAMKKLWQKSEKDRKAEKRDLQERRREFREKNNKKSAHKQPLQMAINAIAKHLDRNKPCIMFPNRWGVMQAGHSYSIGAGRTKVLRYLLDNIHGESETSNNDGNIHDEDRVEAACRRYGDWMRGYLNDTILLNPTLGLNNVLKKEKAALARKILRELQSGAEYTRREIDEMLDIYKLPEYPPHEKG